MSNGQWRVLALLGILLGLEIIRSPTLQTFFKGILTNPLASVSTQKSTSGTSTSTKPGTGTITGAKRVGGPF